MNPVTLQDECSALFAPYIPSVLVLSPATVLSDGVFVFNILYV